VIPEMEALVGNSISRILADKDYRGHKAPNHKFRAFISGQKRGVTPSGSNARCAAGPPLTLGHLKAERRIGRKYLWDRRGDATNAILAAVGDAGRGPDGRISAGGLTQR
jgi:IS5 family transposase